MRTLKLIYDGECPFCSKFVTLMRLREEFNVELINARENRNVLSGYEFDINNGMIVDVDGHAYHGADAVWMISKLSEKPGMLRSRRLAQTLYPFLRMGRNLTLKILRRKPI